MTASLRSSRQQHGLPLKSCLVHKRVASSRSKKLQLCPPTQDAVATTIHVIDHYADLSEAQSAQLWYTSEDLADIKSENELSAADMEDHYGERIAGCIDDEAPKGTTWRGLEWIAEHGQWQRYQHRRNCSNSVLDELDRQRARLNKNKPDVPWDHHAIAAASRQHTHEPRQAAVQRGHHDWAQVRPDFDLLQPLWTAGNKSGGGRCTPNVTRPPARVPSMDGSEITAPLTDDDSDNHRSLLEEYDDEPEDKDGDGRSDNAALAKPRGSDGSLVIQVVIPRKGTTTTRNRIGRCSTFSSTGTNRRAAAAALADTVVQARKPATSPASTTSTTSTTSTPLARIGRSNAIRGSIPGSATSDTNTAANKQRSPIQRSSTAKAIPFNKSPVVLEEPTPKFTRTPIKRCSTAKAMTHGLVKDDSAAVISADKPKHGLPLRRCATVNANSRATLQATLATSPKTPPATTANETSKAAAAIAATKVTRQRVQRSSTAAGMAQDDTVAITASKPKRGLPLRRCATVKAPSRAAFEASRGKPQFPDVGNFRRGSDPSALHVLEDSTAANNSHKLQGQDQEPRLAHMRTHPSKISGELVASKPRRGLPEQLGCLRSRTDALIAKKKQANQTGTCH